MSKENNNNNNKEGFDKKLKDFLLRFQRVPDAEKIFFVQHLGIMIRTGISLSRALKTLGRQTKNKLFKKVIFELHNHVEGGQTLSTGLKKYENIFFELFVNMIEAGEVSGKLEDVLKQLYIQLKKDHRLKAKIRSALIYPTVIFVAMTGIGIGMMIFVVPKLVTIFEGVDLELPLMTRILISLSNNIAANGIIFLIGIVVLVIAGQQILRSHKGKYYWHKIVLKMPIISAIVKKINLAHFARTISSLLKTDIKIVKSFTITANTLGNVQYKKSLLEAAEKVKKGEPIYKALESYPDLYPEMVLQMIDVGEETGELDNILSELSDFYEEEVEEMMNSLPSIIEPIIILVLGLAIGAMAVAIVTPMYTLTNAF